MNIILVSIGNYKNYIVNCINNLFLFGNTNITLITEEKFMSNFQMFPKLKMVDYKTLDLDDFDCKLDTNFREGFWYYSSLRLFVLYAYIKDNKIENVIHLENDVMVYENLDNFNFPKKLFIPVDAYNRSVLSLIYVPDYTFLKKVIFNFNEKKNDMENLGEMWMKDENIDLLPLIPTDKSTPLKYLISKNFTKFNAIFDAAAIGQYLGGIDEFNLIDKTKNNTIGFKNETCVIDYSKFQFCWKKTDRLFKPYLKKEGKLIPIVNLHIHSKNLLKFNPYNPTERTLIPRKYDIYYYVISGIDKSRKPFLKEQFKKYGIPKNRIKWIEGHNKNDLSKLVVNNIYQEPPTNKIDGLYYGKLTLGQISATYKHYLALTDIVINSRKYAVIMEDNVSFKDNIPDTMDKYLNLLPKKWNILFEGDIDEFHYDEGPVTPDKIIYKKDNKVSKKYCGSTRGANFYLINYKTAAKLYHNYLPFGTVVDHWYSHLFRKFNMNIYWAEPTVVHKVKRKSTAT